MATVRLQEGQFTSTIYSLIQQQSYQEAIHLLEQQHSVFQESRAALSLLGYCYFHVEDFPAAAECYEHLIRLQPDEPRYQLYFAQALYKAALYEEAYSECSGIKDPAYAGQVLKLQAAIKHGEGDLSTARSLVEQCSLDDSDTVVNEGCMLYTEKKYHDAQAKFEQAIALVGYRADLSYNVALCCYQTTQYAESLRHIADIIERGIRDHPELSVGMTTEGIEVRSVGNTKMLRDTALVEAFNLKAAIEYNMNNLSAALEAMTDMPPRSEEELDPVTLHNQALLDMEDDVTATVGFEKLQFLLTLPTSPPETFGNLLLLYCKHHHYDLAADVLAENAELTFDLLTQYMFDFLDAILTQQTSPEDAFLKLDGMANQHTDELRKLTKDVKSAKDQRDDEAVKRLVTEYDECLERYIPVLMAQARIYWDMGNYAAVEKIFRKSVEFCNEHDTWRLNVAHVLFMQDTKYKEAIGFYAPIVSKHYENILDVSAVVLANLCVAYIMTSQNDQAEELMKKIETEEENLAYEEPDRKVYHLCIVNLVIGTLYCAKNNYQFGISRVIKSLEPYNKKLGQETWFYAKRCFLALFENMAKQMISLPDETCQDVLQFFDACEYHGKTISTRDPHSLVKPEAFEQGKKTVTAEARSLKNLFMDLID